MAAFVVHVRRRVRLTGGYVPDQNRAASAKPGSKTQSKAKVVANQDRQRARKLAVKDIRWARRQGAADRQAGTASRKYKAFVARYKLPVSDVTLRLWNAYCSAASRPAKASKVGTRPERSRPEVQTPFERAFGTDAVLLKINPPEAIRDAWR
jgi:hypothetical protein